jgi:hypothetical protein
MGGVEEIGQGAKEAGYEQSLFIQIHLEFPEKDKMSLTGL